MAHGPNYKVKYRRRREGKTNYYRRYTYVLNRSDRVVVRLTNTDVIVQFVKFDPKGDITVAAAHSRELMKFGWKGDENNSTACYLTGYLAGLRAKKAGMTSASADLGLFTPTKGARIFYVLKGVIDSGVKVPMGDVGVNNDRLAGKHIAEYAKKLEQEDPDKYRRLFSRYLARGLDPKDLPSHFKEVLNSIKSGEK